MERTILRFFFGAVYDAAKMGVTVRVCDGTVILPENGDIDKTEILNERSQS